MRRPAGGIGILLLAAACGSDGPPAPDVPDAPDPVRAPPVPETFGFGTEAGPERVAAWDVTVYPDGAGLPPGQGTVAEGAGVYAVHCAACHGATGVEGPDDRLVETERWVGEYPPNRVIGAYWPYATTLFDYIRRAMPQLTPGILTPDETYAVIAWILHRNELIGEEEVMDAATLPAVEMPARDRFVPDDRLGTREVR